MLPDQIVRLEAHHRKGIAVAVVAGRLDPLPG
jgi:hypothetical protein